MRRHLQNNISFVYFLNKFSPSFLIMGYRHEKMLFMLIAYERKLYSFNDFQLSEENCLNFSSHLNVYLCRKAFILLSHLVCLLQKRRKRSRGGCTRQRSGDASSRHSKAKAKLNAKDIEHQQNFPIRQMGREARGFPEKKSSQSSSAPRRLENDNEITIIL